ncbi:MULTISPECIES: cysteine desulfurase family protein [unclassified Leifsonia]|uniref:cysteine desulfurase family protein n=1 Tax=unclassified Leifsonia TaxID=2663824 RepID=UPI0006FEDCD4|nr:MULTISPECIES: cysteine desulfurase family protein [unclassified Leifsonia]KQX07169.1 cysteine desulfurase [Leifsonia sp. Root1293]KRA11452.1 cysteine desulfurase [Leifsonia sp. Root60]
MAVYLDHAATTPMSDAAISAYVEAMALVGNPSSIHSQGQNARRLLEEAREKVAASVGCDPIEVVFTGNGTEAINLAIKGLYWARPGSRILVPGGEHHATIDTVEWLKRHEGAMIEWLPLDELGRVRLDALDKALATDPASIALVSMLWANNEVGTIQPIAEIAGLAARHGVPLHLDAVAAYGHVPIDFASLRSESGAAPGVGLVALSVSAHKIGGPVGIGALVLSRTAALEALIHGGGQQRQVRSGTQDVAAAVSFAAASGTVIPVMEAESARVLALRDRLVAGVVAAVPTVSVNGDQDASGHLPGTAHFAFPGCQGDSLLFLLDASGVSVSTGSACQAGIPEPSHVLLAMGRDDETARSALRVTLGRTTTEDDVDAFVAALPAAYAQAARAGLAGRVTSFDR